MIEYFKNFKRYAFRLELLQKYDVSEEKEEFEEFMKTGEIDKKAQSLAMEEWYEIIRQAKQRGAQMKRVHVVVLPLSDYLRFEIAAYEFNVKEGEEVFLLSQADFNKIETSINSDFWLFDDTTVLKMKYGSGGEYLGFDVISENVGAFVEFKEILLSMAKSLHEFELS